MKSYKNTIYDIIREKCSYCNDTELICIRATGKGGYYVVLNKENEKLRTDIYDIISDSYRSKDVICIIKNITIGKKIKGILYKYELI